MSNKYNPAEIEAKWQAVWEEQGLHKTVEDPDRPKWYALTMLPYPSGDLHTGHWYAYTPSDAAARFKRMHGYNVFFPIGFDAFGLPAENAAIKNGAHPDEVDLANIERMRGQLRAHGRHVGVGFRGRRVATRNTTSGASGSSASSTTPAWPIANTRRWTGARTATPRWRASRCGATTATASAAARP